MRYSGLGPVTSPTPHSPTTQRSFSEWFNRARNLLSPDELAILTPPGFALSFAKYMISPERQIGGDNIEERDPNYVGLWMDFYRWVGEKYFRWKVEGVEHVPETGPALLVGSHNGGIIVTDSALSMVAIWDKYGPDRRVYALSHDVLHSNASLRRIAARSGILRAGHHGAAKALAAGHLALVYPGSDLDSTRPFSERHKIELGNRMGFLKLALRQRVPIVPVVSVGTHEQFVVLTREDKIADVFGLQKRFRVGVFPIALALPWGITSGLFPYFPLPAQTSIRFAPRIEWPQYGPEDAENPAILARCYEEVTSHMQRELDLLAKNRVPFLGSLT